MAGPAVRRGFHSTRAQLSSPYHYPEGPRSNIPFNPRTRFFWLRYWGFCGEYRINRSVLEFDFANVSVCSGRIQRSLRHYL